MTNKEIASSAERVLIPKGEASERCVEAFQAFTDIEVPTFRGEQLKAVSQGRTFWKLKGVDIPGLVAVGLGDVGTAGTDACMEYGDQASIRYQPIGEAMCRFSLLAQTGLGLDLEIALAMGVQSGGSRLPIPTARPRMLDYLAARLGLPVESMGLPISGSVEAFASLTGWGLAADLVETGETARQNNLEETFPLCNVCPEIIVSVGENRKAEYMPESNL